MYKESSKEFKESIEFAESGNSHDAFNRSNHYHTYTITPWAIQPNDCSDRD